MPNWVSTSLSVTGSKEEVQRFFDGVKDSKIIESYFPCPKELTETVSGFFTDEEKMEELRKKSEANIAKYGYPNWYEWSYQEWGTKWGDCDTYLEEPTQLANGSWEVTGSFQTAWGPADKGFLKISSLFPSLLFTFEYDEEGGFFAGTHAFQFGEIVFESMYEPCSYEGELDYSDEKSIEKYENWKEEKSDAIFAEYCKFLEGVPS